MFVLDKTVVYFKKRPRLLTGVLLLAMTISGVTLAWLFHSLEPTIGRDELYYINRLNIWYDFDIKQIATAEKYNLAAPPFSLYLMLLVMKSGVSAEFAGRTVNLLFFCTFPLLAFITARLLKFSQKMALCAALLTAVNPTLMEFAVSIMRENSYLFFSVLLMIFILAELQVQKWWHWLMMGICWGLSAMCRLEALAFLLLVMFLLVFRMFYPRKQILSSLKNFMLLVFGGMMSVVSVLFVTDFKERTIKYYKIRFDGYCTYLQKKYTSTEK